MIQSIGRGIRSSKDYCFVYLCDVRYKFFINRLTDIPIRKFNLLKLKSFLENKGFGIQVETNFKNQLTSHEFDWKYETPGKKLMNQITIEKS